MIRKLINKRTLLLSGLVMSSALFMSQCASYNTGSLMQGEILKQNGNEYYLCTANGAREGQVLNVYTTEEDPALVDTPVYMEKVFAGKIKITDTVNQNCANAVLFSGKAEVYDSVDVK